MGIFKRIADGMVSTRLSTKLSMQFSGAIDPLLMRLSKGRVFTTKSIGIEAVLLTTIGAKSGKPREAAMLAFEDGDNLIVIASKGGDARHPAWYHNLRANPQVRTLYRGREEDRIAREAESAERERLWQMVQSRYPHFDRYQERAGDRRIPVIVLMPV